VQNHAGWKKKIAKGPEFCRGFCCSIFRWIALCFQEITYAKKGTQVGKTKNYGKLLNIPK